MRKDLNGEPSTFTLTGRDASIIMGFDDEALVALWQRKRGEGEKDRGPSLVGELAKASLAANKAAFERATGRKVVTGETRLRHPRLRWMGAILEGRLEDGALFEAKFVPGSDIEPLSARIAFLAHVQHDLWAAQAKVAALSILTGDGRWFETSIEADPLYQHLLLTAEKRFLRALEAGERPTRFLLEPPASEAAPLTVVDMSSSREWAQAAREFKMTARAHAEHERARARLAKLLPADVFRGAAAGVVAERVPLGPVRFSLIEAAPHA